MKKHIHPKSLGSKVWGFLRYILTDKNDDWDLSILLWLYAVLLYLYKATIVLSDKFDFLNFGAGCLGIFAAGKGLDWLTERHDKKGKENASNPPSVS